MKTFTMYRRADLSATHDSNQANDAHEPQFEGVVFSDGRVAVRWLTAKASVSVWDCLDDLLAIHGHPEYDSELIWTRSADSLKQVIRLWLRDGFEPGEARRALEPIAEGKT